MTPCPNCHQEVARRKNGACPHCAVEIELYGGAYFLAAVGNPPTALLEKFEGWVSKQQSTPTLTVNFRIPRKGSRWQRELNQASRLLQMADMDLGKAFEALELLFTNSKFSWRSRASLTGLNNDFLLALAIVQALRDQAAKEVEKQTQYVQTVLTKEDVFAD